jgi:DNA-binding NarL/FixJ family response regulator
MSPLSQRETQVLALARLGRSTKEIAAELGISTSTVNWHRKQGLARQRALSVRTARGFPMAGRKAVIDR